MALTPKDTVTANKPNTAVCVQAQPDTTGDMGQLDPEYVAVRGDAAGLAEALLREQQAGISRRCFNKLAVIVGITLAVMVIAMVITQNFMIADYSVLLMFGLLVATVLPPFLTSGGVSAEGVEINHTVYCHLTPEDRDALFQAQEESPDVLQAAVKLLTERYSADESRRRVEKQQRDQARATAILVSHERLD